MQNIHGKEIDLLRTTVKVPGKRLPRATPATAPGTSPRANGLASERSTSQLGGGTGEGLLRPGVGAPGERGRFARRDRGGRLRRPKEVGAVGLPSVPAWVLGAPGMLVPLSPAQPNAFARALASWDRVEAVAGTGPGRRCGDRGGPDSLVLPGAVCGPGTVSPHREPTGRVVVGVGSRMRSSIAARRALGGSGGGGRGRGSPELAWRACWGLPREVGSPLRED